MKIVVIKNRNKKLEEPDVRKKNKTARSNFKNEKLNKEKSIGVSFPISFLYCNTEHKQN